MAVTDERKNNALQTRPLRIVVVIRLHAATVVSHSRRSAATSNLGVDGDLMPLVKATAHRHWPASYFRRNLEVGSIGFHVCGRLNA